MTGVSIKMRPPAHLVNKNILMRTESYKRTDIEESWIIMDAKGKTLGRFASKIADILSGNPVSYYKLSKKKLSNPISVHEKLYLLEESSVIEIN